MKAVKQPPPKSLMTTDNSTGKHTQIVQVLIPQPEPKKQAPKRRIARKAKVDEALTEPVPPLFNGYKPIYSSFSPVPSFSPSIDISYGGEKEPPRPTATVPPIEVEEPIKAPAPKKKGSKLKGVLKGIGKGIASAVEAIGELPTQQPSGLIPLTPPPVIPVEAYNPDYIPPREMPEFQMYQPTPYLLTGEPMTQEQEIQTEAPRATTETGTGGTPVIYAPPPPTPAQKKANIEKEYKAILSRIDKKLFNKANITKMKDLLSGYGFRNARDFKEAGLTTRVKLFDYLKQNNLLGALEQNLYSRR